MPSVIAVFALLYAQQLPEDKTWQAAIAFKKPLFFSKLEASRSVTANARTMRVEINLEQRSDDNLHTAPIVRVKIGFFDPKFRTIMRPASMVFPKNCTIALIDDDVDMINYCAAPPG